MKIKSVKKIILLVVLALIITGAAVLGFSLYMNYNNSIQTNAQFLSSLNKQLGKATNNRISEIENIANVVFSDPNVQKHAADNERNEDIEDDIEQAVNSLSLMDNFSDFGILYENDRFIGTLSVGTSDLFGEKKYAYLDGLVGENKTFWASGLNDDFRRVYYFRRINDSAVFVSSIYSTELAEVFITQEHLGSANCYIINEHEDIVCSSDCISGVKLDGKYSHAVKKSNCTVINTNYIESVNDLKNGWQIVTILPLSSNINFFRKTALAGVGIIVLLLVITLTCYIMISASENVAASAELSSASDSLTGLYNAEATENLIADKIETCITGSTIMLALISIKNYRLIFENYGSAGVNEALLTVSAALNDMYGENGVVGRMGMNEFAVFADFTEYDLFKAHDKLKESLKELDKRLEECELSSNRGMIKCAVGAAIYPDSSSDYDELIECAKSALEEALDNDDTRHILHKTPASVKGGN